MKIEKIILVVKVLRELLEKHERFIELCKSLLSRGSAEVGQLKRYLRFD